MNDIETPRGFPSNWTVETIRKQAHVQYVIKRGASQVCKTSMANDSDARAELRAKLSAARQYAAAMGDKVS